MKFVDEAVIYVRSGDGGRGCISFRRERFVPKGGPDGGDGGRGGNVIIIAAQNLTSLLDFKYKQHFIAKRGGNGRGKKCHGKDAPDLIIRVPAGTVIKDIDKEEVIGDLVEPDEWLLIAKGGRGGRGNARFATSTNQAPRYAEPGESGEEKRIKLELKLLADAGIIGLPNAGKSTLIASLSAARPKIASYPFTTLTPNLGVVRYRDFKTFVVADIPGLIKDAHRGAGLGTRFLRHIERTSLLLHVIDISPEAGHNPLEAFEIVTGELSSFDPELLKKRHIVVLNKIDALGEEKRIVTETENTFKRKGLEVYSISAVTGEGVGNLINAIGRHIFENEEGAGNG